MNTLSSSMRSIISSLLRDETRTPRITRRVFYLLLEIQVQLVANSQQKNLMVNKQRNSVSWRFKQTRTQTKAQNFTHYRIQLQMRITDLSKQRGVAEHLETVVALRALTRLKKTWCSLNHSPYFRLPPPCVPWSTLTKLPFPVSKFITMFPSLDFEPNQKSPVLPLKPWAMCIDATVCIQPQARSELTWTRHK